MRKEIPVYEPTMQEVADFTKNWKPKFGYTSEPDFFTLLFRRFIYCEHNSTSHFADGVFCLKCASQVCSWRNRVIRRLTKTERRTFYRISDV